MSRPCCPLCRGTTTSVRPDHSRTTGSLIACANRGCELREVEFTDTAWGQFIRREDVQRLVAESTDCGHNAPLACIECVKEAFAAELKKVKR